MYISISLIELFEVRGLAVLLHNNARLHKFVLPDVTGNGKTILAMFFFSFFIFVIKESKYAHAFHFEISFDDTLRS